MEDFVILDCVLKKYNGKGGDVVIPDGVKEIGSWIFNSCDTIKSVVIPKSVKNIGYNAFRFCGFTEDFFLETADWRFKDSLAISNNNLEYSTNRNIKKKHNP